MESNWKLFLKTKGAVIDKNTVLHFGNLQQERNSINAENTTVVADLSHYSVIKISGSDAQTFLQSQFSNDVNTVTKDQAQLNSYCSPKGRVLALFILFKINNDFYLQLPTTLLDSVLKRLTMFKMRADVNLTDYSDSLLCIGIAGSSAESIITDKISELSNSNYATKTQDSLTIIRLNNGIKTKAQSRFLIFGTTESLTSFWTTFNNKLNTVGQGPWSLLDIYSGIPRIETETLDAFVPQMLNLQLIDAVSFKKGCYPGQEIVARTQYLGKLKKRMYYITSDEHQTLISGTDLTTENADDEQSKGKIVNCQINPEGGIDALAVLQINCTNQGAILVKSTPEIKFTIQDLPYTFDELE